MYINCRIISLQHGYINTGGDIFLIEPLHDDLHRVMRQPRLEEGGGGDRRQKRAASLGDRWPPPSHDNWVEVVVVVDGPMVKYHGKNVRHYVLSLMKIVSMIGGDN